MVRRPTLKPGDMHDVDVAIAVAGAGASVVRRCFGTTLQRLDKGAGDFATNADIEAEHRLPEEFEIYSYDCEKHRVTAKCKTRSGAWCETELVKTDDC